MEVKRVMFIRKESKNEDVNMSFPLELSFFKEKCRMATKQRISRSL